MGEDVDDAGLILRRFCHHRSLTAEFTSFRSRPPPLRGKVGIAEPILRSLFDNAVLVLRSTFALAGLGVVTAVPTEKTLNPTGKRRAP